MRITTTALLTVIALVGLSCAPAFAEGDKATTWLRDFQVREGRFGTVQVMIKAECPGGEELKVATSDPLEAAALVSMISGVVTRGDFLEWLGEYAPERVSKAAEALNACYLGADKGA